MGFFGLIALLLMVIAVGFFIPVLAAFLQTGQVLKFPTLIVCVFTALAAIQSFFSGLILGNMTEKNRKDFEGNLIQVNEEYKHKISE